MAEKITLVDDFDGDGFVCRAEVVKDLSPAPRVRLTINSGNHATTLDLNPEDLGNFIHLMENSRKHAMKALVGK